MDTSAKLVVSKIDAARRQIETAINLYFSHADPVSIHTLASAGFNVLSDICDKRGVTVRHFRKLFLERVKPEHKKELIQSLRRAENFFKHADTDPEESFSLAPALTDYVLIDAVELYVNLTAEVPPLLGLYRVWWQGQNRHLFLDKQSDEYRLLTENADLMTVRRKFFELALPVFTRVAGS